MPDTGERGEIKSRAAAHEAKVVSEEKVLVRKSKEEQQHPPSKEREHQNHDVHDVTPRHK